MNGSRSYATSRADASHSRRPPWSSCDRAGRGRAGATYRARVRKGGAVITRSFATLPAALAWRAQVLEAVTDGGEVPPPALAPARSLTVEDAARVLARGMVDGTVRTRTGTRYKPSVVRNYEEQLRTLVVPRIGPMPVAAITKGDVQRLVDAIAARRTPEHARRPRGPEGLDAGRRARRRHPARRRALPRRPRAGRRSRAAACADPDLRGGHAHPGGRGSR
jgi:hypothetical protein